MCCLRLALIFCCGCMLSLIFIFTWHPLKEKIPGEQVSRSLLSWDCEKLFQFIPKEKLLLSTGVGWRKVVVVDGCWMKSPGEIKFRLFRWWWWLKFLLSNSGGGVLTFRWCWWHCKYFIFITGIICIKSMFRAVWPVMFFISHFGNPKDSNFRTVVFLAEWFVIFLVAHNSANH